MIDLTPEQILVLTYPATFLSFVLSAILGSVVTRG